MSKKAPTTNTTMAHRDIDVYVKLSSGRSVQYDMDPGQDIASLIALVAKDEAVATNQVRLKYQGKILVTTKTIREYGVRAETILKSEVLVPKHLALVVNLPDGNVEEITLSNLDSTNSLFEVIVDKCGVSKNQLEVKCKGQKLNASQSKLLDFGIENCAEINVKIKEKIEEPTKKSERGAAAAVVDEIMDESEKESVLTSFQSNGRQVEVVFSFDTTGSMFQYLAQVRTKLRECCTRLIQDIPTIRIGLMAQGDYCDEGSPYVIRSVDLTNDVETLVSFANDVPSTSGGDCPECYEWVLRKAQHLDWSEESAKALVVIGDNYPHPPHYTDQNIRWRDELDVLKGMGVKVYGVQAGSCSNSGMFYAEISEVTEGRYLKLAHLDVITDMFLAVCYREGNEQLLEDFQQEVQGAGRMSEQTKAMFEELKETDEEKKEKKKKENGASSSSPGRYVRQDWWDHSLSAKGQKPQFTYDAQADTWKRYQDSINVTAYNTEPRRITTSLSLRNSGSRRSSRRRGVSKRCNIM